MGIIDILSIVINLGILIGLAFVYRKIKKAVTVFVEPVDERTPSPLAQTIDHTAKVFVGRAAEYFGMHDKAQGSASARRENAVDSALITDLISGAHPLGALLATNFPNLAKKLGKNPALLPYVLQKLQGMNLGGGNGHTEQPVDFNVTKI